MTELFIIGARIFGRILEDVGWAGGETTVCEHAHLDVTRVDLGEEREATGPEIWSGFGGRDGGDGEDGRTDGKCRSVLSMRRGRGIREEEMDALEERHQA